MAIAEYAIKISEYRRKATPFEQIDEALEELNTRKTGWASMLPEDLTEILGQLIEDIHLISESWVHASLTGKKTETSAEIAQEWVAGPYVTIRNLYLLKRSLTEIVKDGRPAIPGPVRVRPDGQVTARVFPADAYDRLFYAGTTAEVWMCPEVAKNDLAENMARAYQKKTEPGTALVLGGGNVSSIGPMDCLYKLFVHRKVVILKMHPVNAYLGSLFEVGFRTLIKQGYLRIVYGDAEEGAYLCRHRLVNEIHITGSDKTHDLIVFGNSGKGEGATPTLEKPITSELGNVSPVIVVPGPWTQSDLAFQAENVVSSLVNNAGFNCNATRVLVTADDWPLRKAFLDEIRLALDKVDRRTAYYPGAEDRYSAFQKNHPEAELFGENDKDRLPWMFIPDLDSGKHEDICFTQEAFCGVFGETPLPGSGVSAFLENALHFANDVLWGTLNVTVLVHPKTAKAYPDEVEAMIAGLRFGTVSVNHWAAMGYALGVTTWGAFPGHVLQDIQSGIDVVHNTFMFDKPQKSVIRGPFRVRPKPLWFFSHRKAHLLAPSLTNFQARPSIFKLPEIFFHALRG